MWQSGPLMNRIIGGLISVPKAVLISQARVLVRMLVPAHGTMSSDPTLASSSPTAPNTSA